MNIYFSSAAYDDFEYLREQEPEAAEKVLDMLSEIRLSPFKGTGKPEGLKYDLAGFWSRRITKEHRLVYKVSGKGKEQKCEVVQCRFHY